MTQIPVHAMYNAMIVDQTGFGMAYLYCFRQTLSRINVIVKGEFGDVVNLQWNYNTNLFSLDER